ncbi:zinc-dependent alcohol dehydrogenase family protein [Dictyoglomus thermophilum]|uniref:alcohol dehydrogenase n=1 Tax=Dictyoglomus thermophilum (strain ATCC 35947 / DSM 3960 / H-6-12) TaxID=309799 RepID=B5YBK5_DICT6|nr:zinc-dependent alcohol dehydrogenase family protein [Dictyoglomus thermophilum]ACI18697.1 alcohol dehydrogenase [Dictyoglomus thermophilum H-6-12]
MKAMLLREVKDLTVWQDPLSLEEVSIPIPKEKEILIKVSACGVCRTDLDIVEGRLPPTKLPLILGHQIVGTVVDKGKDANKFQIGDRVGVAWINHSCGVCRFCRSGQENLCDDFKATGKDVDGGYAEYTVVSEDYAYKIPQNYSDEEAAPLLCAGAIGYRSVKLSNIKNGDNIGLSGFGASGHLVLKIIKYLYPDSKIFVFARSERERELAKELGSYWTGDFGEVTPFKLNAIIDTTPVWKTIVLVLRNLEKGGRLVINAIRKENQDKDFLINLNYERDLWMEKEIKSVANITRRDVEEFLTLAEKVDLKPVVEVYKLEEANKALRDLKEGRIRGAKVLKMS